MTDNNDAQTDNKTDAPHQQALQINIKMQQNEHSSQPIYSNFTSVQGGQRIIIVDFGFVDPQVITALNRMAKSGEKTPDTIDVKMSCRMALSMETANQLAQQLNQLLHTKPAPQAQAEQHKVANNINTPLNTNIPEEKNISAESQRGFKFPWSS